MLRRCADNITQIQGKKVNIKPEVTSNHIYHADCMKLLPMLSAESIDLILTDPPYGISYKSKNQALHNQQVAGDKHPYIWWLHEAARILKEDGGLLCFTRWDVLGDWKAAIEWADLTVRSCIVWDKASHGMGNTKAQFAPQHGLLTYSVSPSCRPRR